MLTLVPFPLHNRETGKVVCDENASGSEIAVLPYCTLILSPAKSENEKLTNV